MTHIHLKQQAPPVFGGACSFRLQLSILLHGIETGAVLMRVQVVVTYYQGSNTYFRVQIYRKKNEVHKFVVHKFVYQRNHLSVYPVRRSVEPTP